MASSPAPTGQDAQGGQRGGHARSGVEGTGQDAQGGQRGGHDARSSQRALSVLLYSDDSEVREAVRLAVGRRPAPDLPEVRWTEVATEPAVVAAADAGGLDVLVLDGEAVPAGGMGLCKQLKDEIYRCPPVLVLIGRPADAWLATWSRADLVVPHPLDPVAVAEAVAELARRRLAG